MHFETRAIHGAGRPDKAYGAVSVPIYQTSTFVYDDIGKSRGFNYSREANPTRQALEDTLANLESGKRGFAFASGVAAEMTVAHLLKQGEHLLNIVDLKVVAEVAKSHNLLTVIDNTFATPYFQRPLEYGIDIVVHSLTKYLGGHSDVIGGAVITSNDELAHRIYYLQKGLGAVLGPQDSWLVLRGIETLAVRMDRHAANAMAVAQFLEKHPAVARVLYPGLPSHPGHEIAKRQMSGFGGMVTFELKAGLPGAEKFLRSIKVFTLADSLGGTHSLAEAPYVQSHASMDAAYRAKIGITPGLIRLSVGLEHVDDLLADLTQALNW